MKDFKTYKSYYKWNYTLKNINKIETIKRVLKVNDNNWEELDTWRTREDLTEKQWQLFYNKDFKELKKLLKKQLEKEQTKLKDAEQKALASYENIKTLQNIDKLIIEIEWSAGRRSMGAYQTKAIGQAFYTNGDYKRFETTYTSGCGYDKMSTSAAEVCNELAKIVLLKHYSKIVKDNERHWKYYAGEYGYFQYGVGIGSYETFFKNCGYKVNCLYHSNDNLTMIIERKRR